MPFLYFVAPERHQKNKLEAENLLFEVKQLNDHRLNKLVWHVEGIGFEGASHEGFSKEHIQEQIAVVRLLMSWMYWY